MIDGLESALERAEEELRSTVFPAEKVMQDLYNDRMAARARPPSRNRRGLTKKQVPGAAARCRDPGRAEELLRNLLKAGDDRSSRVVDSSAAADRFYPDRVREGGEGESMARRAVAARLLTEDAARGGRFKRRSCLFVSSRRDEGAWEATLVNGGWIAVDPSTKAGTEGRKFSATNGARSARGGGASSEPLVLTAADERIVRRLECLAMGDAWKDDVDGMRDEKALEVDVREALRGLVPALPAGATEALIGMGLWSEETAEEERAGNARRRVEPWSPELLDAARSLALYEGERRGALAAKCYGPEKRGASKVNGKWRDDLEGRTDLSSLPCVCVDAPRTSFRDDALGIRLRSSTGRKVDKAASKWEILVHVCDVSDVYFDEQFQSLREAAEGRGLSRYDLPLGPLHLLPPPALKALSLATNEERTPNRCVTLWAYVDKRTGKLLEAGLERTAIAPPRALSFADATRLLEGDVTEVPRTLSNAKAVLSVVERNLSLWSRRHRLRNEAARKREKRLATKEQVSSGRLRHVSIEMHVAVIWGPPRIYSSSHRRNNFVEQVSNAVAASGGETFQRSRGHLMVDSSLDLYAHAVGTLMKRAKQPIPRAAGSGEERGGRLGTAPLRRYIDGIAQRQALSALCDYGRPLSLKECRKASKIASQASDKIDNLRSSKHAPLARSHNSKNLQSHTSALHSLACHLASRNWREVKAVSTGHNNEVVVLGAGARAKCKGVKGMLKSGEHVLVRVDEIRPETGILDVSLVSTQPMKRI
ncbi:hypothetical protein ACHAWF_018382 [Thalassiosira exigua]